MTIEEARIYMGMTQKDLAKLMGISHRAYTYKCKGDYQWSLKELTTITDNCDTDLLIKSGDNYYRVNIQKVG